MNKNNEKIKEYYKEYYQKNKERLREKRKEYYKEYYQKNKERLREKKKEYLKEYYQKNKERLREKKKEYLKEYRKENKEKFKNYNKKYYEKNKEAKILRILKWREKNKEKVKERTRKYNKENREKFRNYYKKRYQEIYKNNTQYKLGKILRNRLHHALKGNVKNGSAVHDLGCTLEELKVYLENQFQEGMTWENWKHDGWHIDHIKPLSIFDLTDPVQLKEACHYTNLQPLWAHDNISKGDKIDWECEFK